jgi:hypothetical protein
MMDAFSQKATQASCSYVEAIGTKIIWSSSPSGSPFLRSLNYLALQSFDFERT